MYHISKDPRAVRSAGLIGAGLLQCLQAKRFTEITVTDVQKAATVGRATFYRLFDNTADVLSYLCDQVFEQTAREYAEMRTWNPEETTLKYIQKWMENRELLSAIVESNRMDLLYDAHLKYVGVQKACFFSNAQMSEEQMTYLMTTMTACTSAFLAAWLKNGACERAEELQQRLKECFCTLGKIFEA